MDAVLRGFGIILFWDNTWFGLLLGLVFLLNPWAGGMAFLGAASATLMAFLIRTDRSLIRTGLYACNGGLVGLVSVSYVIHQPALIGLVALTAAFSTVLLAFLMRTLTTQFHLPVLTLPFLLASWALLAAIHHLPASVPWSAYYRFDGVLSIETTLWTSLPNELVTFFRSIGWLFYQDSVLLGVLGFLVLALRSRLYAALALAGYLVGLGTVRGLGLTSNAAGPGVEVIVSFNSAFTAVILGAFFLRLNAASVLFGLFGASCAALITAAAYPAFSDVRLPVLNGPFVAVSLLFLGVVGSKAVSSRQRTLVPVPLHQVGSTPSRFPLPRLWGQSNDLQLTLPFWGTWYVAQGNHGMLTHWGHGSYAWDFVVIDEQGRTTKGIGRRAEDYYSFGLPVIAPADGTVVRVVNWVRDNIPPEVNEKEQWGNLVIIDHGGSLLSEISHFSHGGVVVKEGQKVVRGQLVGYVGNSGRSQEPHLHFQIQRGPEIGAATVLAKFWNYYRIDGQRKILVKKGVPHLGDMVRNVFSQDTPQASRNGRRNGVVP
ncbi:MAG: urea transporter [Chloroflexi bacterium]|nr:urea transporter [Chloroflexota bacterium]